MRGIHPEGAWCWTHDDPELTYPDPSEWHDGAGPFCGKPFVQRFDWGVPAPSSWVVFYEDEHEYSEWKEFATEEEAKAFLAALPPKVEA